MVKIIKKVGMNIGGGDTVVVEEKTAKKALLELNRILAVIEKLPVEDPKLLKY